MKKAKGVILRVFLLALGLELASAAGWSILRGELFTWSRARAARAVVAASQAPGDEAQEDAPSPTVEDQGDASLSLMLRIRDQALHPYVGFVFSPSLNAPDTRAAMGGREITRYGFIGNEDYFEEPREDRIVIGIAGGSVAAFFSTMGAATLVEELHAMPELAGKEIVFVTMALLGYKQPQQLFALQYALTLGGHFDWVINLDGLNEVALAPIENTPKGVAAIYPRSWYWRVQDVPDGATRRWMGQVAYLEGRRGSMAAAAQQSLFRASATANLIWLLRDRSLQAGIGRAERALVELTPEEGENTFQASGPFNDPADEAAQYEELTAIWKRSSLQMHRVCEANGIRYWHFLQPNQYVPDTKPMGSKERALAYSAVSPFKSPVEAGYPRLVAASDELRRAGVRFHDLTEVFVDTPEALYIDNCCHLGELGNEILARTMAQAIRSDLAGE